MSAEPIRVLVADDDVIVREALAELIASDPELELAGTAGDAGEAAATAGERRPHVAIVDVRMPGGGPAVARAIAARHPAVRIVGLSAYGSSDSIREMVDAGAAGYVMKGTSGDALLEAVKRCARGERVLPGSDELRDAPGPA